MNNEISFGPWLKERRKELGLTQRDLALRVGCSPVTIEKIESGERRPSKQVAELIADTIGVLPAERQAFVDFARVGLPSNSRPPTSTVGQSAPWRAVHRVPNNLPAQPTAFIGREGVVAAVRDLLRRPGTRLVTLTGPPGIGKSRLSVEVATELLDDFADGVFFVALAPIRHPDLMVPTIAQVLGVREVGVEPLMDTLKAYLRDRQVLLLLDNFEQIVPAGLALSELILAARGLKMLVTSREPLHLYGEYEYPVPPLSTPGNAHLPAIGRLLHFEAVRLFVERAEATRHDFALTRDNAPDVVQICAGLDGLPLAIELAAARANYLTPADMRSQMQDRLALLTGGPSDRPPRQQTLRGAIAWSYDILDDDQKALFRCLSVFVGGCTLNAVEAVKAILEPGSSHIQNSSDASQLQNPKSKIQNIEPLLASLVDKSLLRRETPAESEAPRFEMLETIREYAWWCALEDASSGGLQRAHALHYTALAEEAEAQLQGAGQKAWLDTLEREYANLRAALKWSLASGNPADLEMGLRIAGALGKFWELRGYFSEGRETVTALLDSTANTTLGKSAARAKALNVAGRLALYPGDFVAARSTYEESLAISTSLGNKAAAAASLNHLGVLFAAQGEHEKARAQYEQSLAIRRELGDEAGIANTLNSIGSLALAQGDYPSAQALCEESLAIRRRLDHKHGITLSLSSLAETHRALGDFSRAEVMYTETLDMSRELGNRAGMANALHNLGHVAHHKGDLAGAAALFKQSLEIYSELGEMPGVAECLAGLAGVLASASLSSGTSGHASKQTAVRAATLFGASRALLERINFRLNLVDRQAYDRSVEIARSTLDEDAWSTAFTNGLRLPPDQAVALALRAASSLTHGG
jgi:predicted ATPase/DNA-binding XRE family transcriptional regulator/Tfp pilus assembly protein PilF